MESIDEQLSMSLQKLNSFPESALKDFVDANLCFLRNPKEIDLLTLLDEVSKKHKIKNKKILKVRRF